MLSEFPGVAQREGEGRRRWFSDEKMDLIVWYSPAGSVTGFQLCYDRDGDERALTWRDGPSGGGLVHARVDSGEDDPARNRSPVLADAGPAPLGAVREEFLRRAGELEPEVVALVRAKLGG